MVSFLAGVRQYFEDIYPGLFNAVIGGTVVLLLWGLKKWRPDLFAKLPQTVQALPALFLAGLVSAMSAAEPTIDAAFKQFFGGLLGGVFAVGLHRVLKESPLPYGNPPGSGMAMHAKKTTVTLLFLVAFLPGCSPSDWAAVQTVASDVVKIAQVLCLADQAKAKHVDAITVKDLCQTADQLAPYMAAAKNPELVVAAGSAP